jgi:diguanylate cyclase (GGDEF)-like protein/PAS domain S-box-containing protein
MPSRKSSRKNKPASAFDEQTFSLMFEWHSVVMLLTEPQSGEIIDANQAAVKFYGYPKSKLCSMSLNEINILPAEKVEAERQNALKEKRDYFIFPHRLAGGEERIVEVHSSLIALQEREVLFSIVHDITERRQAEEAMNFELYLMHVLMNNSPAHIYFKDRESRFIKITNAQAKLFGLSDPEQALGKTDFDYFTAEHANQAYEDEQEIIRTGQPISREEKETRYNLPDTWISTSKLPLRDKDGNIIGTFGISVDITEHKRAEDALSIEQYLMQALMNSVPVQIYFKDRKSRFIRVNSAQARLFGLSDPRQAIGKTDFDFFSNEHAQQAYGDEQIIIETGKPISKEEKETWANFPDTWVSTTKLPLRDKDEKIIGTFGISMDITDRKQAAEALNESKLLFHLLIESLPQNIYAKDVDGRFVFANQRYCAIQGKSLKEIVGKTDFDLHPPEMAEKYRSDDRHVIETGKTIDLIEEHQVIGEKKFFVQVIKAPFYDSKGQTAGTLGIFWDITERQQAEADLRRAQVALETAHRELQQSFEREQYLAHMDELTGINNHRSLLKLIEHEFNISLRYQSPLSMMFFDVDHFKKINDAFGHAVGDQALKKVVKVVCAELRSADEIGRYGGDEFVVLLPQTGAQEVLRLAERIHASVAAISMNTDNGPLTLTISIGIAQTVHSAMQPDSVQNLLLRADQALYAAKQNGRNCTVIFDQN